MSRVAAFIVDRSRGRGGTSRVLLPTLLLTVLGGASGVLAAPPVFTGPLPYQSIADSPYFGDGQTCHALETFPDGLQSQSAFQFNSQSGAEIVPGIGVPPGGHVLQANVLGVIELSFNPPVTQAGFVWTGGDSSGSTITITVISGTEAITNQYSNLPSNDPNNPDDNRFFGVVWDDGIEFLRIAFLPFGPSTPNQIDHIQFSTEPGICGCGVLDTDTDGDGVLDCLDGCPDDPAKTEPGICGCGVAEVDFDGDGVTDCVDDCLEGLTVESPTRSPFSADAPLTHVFEGLPGPTSDATLSLEIRADLGSFSEFVTVYFEGESLGLFFTVDGEDCPEAPAMVSIPIAQSTLAKAIAGGGVEVEVVASPLVGAADCPTSFARVRLAYAYDAGFLDCNGNGLNDSCEIASGKESDCNANGVPDACDLDSGLLADCDGNGLVDLCEILDDPILDENDDQKLDACSYAYGDFDLDGSIGGADLAYLLSIWGLKNLPIGDLTDDGSIDGADLALLLSRWGSSVP